MSPVVSSVLTFFCAFGAGLVPAFADENKRRSLWWKINLYLACVAMWASIFIIGGLLFKWHAESQATEDGAWHIVTTAIIIVIPTAITAGAMWVIGRTPTLDELARRVHH